MSPEVEDGPRRERRERGSDIGLWHTLGYRLRESGDRRAVVEWDASAEYGFPTSNGHLIQGGLVTALLDSAMAHACLSSLEDDQPFLTADIRVEFLEPVAAGQVLCATGEVLRSGRRVWFCRADLHDSDGALLATSRCTQVILADRRHPR